MSRSKGIIVEDIWSKIDKDPKLSSGPNAAVSLSEDASSPTVPSTICTSSTSIVFIGDSSCGKSTLIQSFLKPTVTAKEAPKPTIALDYNFARRTSNGVKSVANIWEVGGDLVEPKLIEIGITKGNFAISTVIIVCDLSKPQNVLSSILRSFEAVEDIATKRTSELKAVNVNMLNELRDYNFLTFKDHVDAQKVKPLDIPVFIIANKFDLFNKSVKPAERRAVLQILRFAAQYYGAGIMSVSSTAGDSAAKDAYRSLLTNLCFNVPVKPICEISGDKFVYITKAQDSFNNIFTDSKAVSSNDSKVRLLAEADMDKLLTAKGITRDCWNRLSAHMVSIFGEPDPLTGSGEAGGGRVELGQLESGINNNAEDEKANANPFPEPEIDDVRALKDAELLRYIQDVQRKEEMLIKLNASSSNAGK